MHKQIAINRITNPNTSLVSRWMYGAFCSMLGQLSLEIQVRGNAALQRSRWGEEDNTIGNQIENEVENIKCLSEFNKLPAENVVEILRYCSNGTANALVTTCRDVASNDILTPQFLRYRDLNENTIRVRENFKLDVRELGYGQKIPAYMFDECRVLEGHTNEVSSVIVLRNGKLATGSQDNTIRIWDLNKQEGEDGYCRVLEDLTDSVRTVIELRNGKKA